MGPGCSADSDGDGDGDGNGEVVAEQIQSPPFGSMGPSCCGGDGEVATESAKLSSDASAGAGSEDRLSALPDDILVLILHRIDTRAAARTSVLSRRWRRVWTLLPALSFLYAPDPHQIGLAIQAHEAAIRCLLVGSRDAGPESLAAWLPVAAPRLYGSLFFGNIKREGSAKEIDEEEEEGPGQSGAFELPCLERATNVVLQLGFIGLAVPLAGVFARLTKLCLQRVRLYGPGDLGDAVSWPRCPCLQKLSVRDARGLDNLNIQSDSLRQVELINVQGLRQLNIVAQALEELEVNSCFLDDLSPPVASITAPWLATLEWNDTYDPSSVHLSKMKSLRLLRPFFFMVYGPVLYNQSCLSLVRRFKVIECLMLSLVYVRDIDDYEYMMEDMTMLPDIAILELNVLANGHAFGASAFHVLRMCSSIKKLMLSFVPPNEVEVQNTCPPGCICGEHQNWETEHLLLNRLKEVEVTLMRGSEHEVTFVKQLFNWATSLEKMRVVFDKSVTESMVKELSQVLRSFARPGISMEIHMYMEDILKMMNVPED